MSMHGLIRQRLEDYLREGPARKLPPEFETHLQTCEECREELSWMREQCHMLRGLRPSRTIEPPAGFYARVMERVEAQERGSFWNAFLDPVFGRRLVATTLTLAVMLGGYLAFTEAQTMPLASGNAETIMALEEHPPGLGLDRQRDRETMLVTLATYHE
jgi:predicted anti-sigma-YlaC factor YlaD